MGGGMEDVKGWWGESESVVTTNQGESVSHY